MGHLGQDEAKGGFNRSGHLPDSWALMTKYTHNFPEFPFLYLQNGEIRSHNKTVPEPGKESCEQILKQPRDLGCCRPLASRSLQNFSSRWG